MSPGGLPGIGGILQNFLLVGHLILRKPVGIQALHLTGIRGGDVTRTIHEMNSKRQGLLLLMVKSRLVKKLRLGFLLLLMVRSRLVKKLRLGFLR